MELRARIAKALLTRAQRAEILGGLGHLVAVKAKVDLAWPEKRYALKSDILRGSTGLSPGQDSDEDSRVNSNHAAVAHNLLPGLEAGTVVTLGRSLGLALTDRLAANFDVKEQV